MSAVRFEYRRPSDDGDGRDDRDPRTCDRAPTGFRLIGARVRGRKHKHDGRHCDDRFAFDRFGPWTVVAVADGAGSKPLSRIGAQIACETVMRSCRENLAGIHPADRTGVEGWTDALTIDEEGRFVGPDLQAARQALIAAFRSAAVAVAAEATRRSALPVDVTTSGRSLDDLPPTSPPVPPETAGSVDDSDEGIYFLPIGTNGSGGADRAPEIARFSRIDDETDRASNTITAATANDLVKPSDLACTLLVAAHATVGFGDSTRDLIIACNVGDGMTAALNRNATPILLARQDAGAFAGETAFLTDPTKVTEEALSARTFVSLCQLDVLMVMTDGVGDDYESSGDGIARLWADLVVNGVPDLHSLDDDAVNAALAGTSFPTRADIAKAPNLDADAEIVEPDPRTKRTIRSSEALAKAFGLSLTQLLHAPELVWAGRATPFEAPLQGETAADRLAEWLDAYQVRSSFDDRTLIVLHRETLS